MVYDSIRLTMYKSVLCFAIPYSFHKSEYRTSNDTIYQTLLDTVIKHRYFLFQQDKTFGLKYDSLTDASGAIFNVDSLKRHIVSMNLRVYDKMNDSLIKKYVSAKEEDVEQHIKRTSLDDSYPDSTYLYFGMRKAPLRFLFTGDLEPEKKMRLSKMKFITLSTFDSTNGLSIPTRLMTIDISTDNRRDECLEELLISFSKRR